VKLVYRGLDNQYLQAGLKFPEGVLEEVVDSHLSSLLAELFPGCTVFQIGQKMFS
jgi:hypothetical protein